MRVCIYLSIYIYREKENRPPCLLLQIGSLAAVLIVVSLVNESVL